MNSLKKEIELKFESEEQLNYVAELVLLKCEIKNNSGTELDLELNLENCKEDDKLAFFWHCELEYEIGKLAPNSSHFVDLAVVPVSPGLLVSLIKILFSFIFFFFIRN